MSKTTKGILIAVGASVGGLAGLWVGSRLSKSSLTIVLANIGGTLAGAAFTANKVL